MLETLGVTYSFVQDNVSYSTEAGTIRGYTFKNPKAQTKLIQAMQGAIMTLSLICEKIHQLLNNGEDIF